MPADQLCYACFTAINQARNGDTITLCTQCQCKSDAVTAAISWKACRTGEWTLLNIELASLDSGEEEDESSILWPLLITIGIVILSIAAVLLAMCFTPAHSL